MRDPRFFLRPHYSNHHALVIGIDEYVSAPPLGYAVSDAQGFRQVLIDVVGFEEQNVILLTNENATRQKILTEFLRFSSEKVGVDDRIIIFFAGHGHTRLGNRGETGYLVPYDADMSDFSTFIRWDDLTRNADHIRAKHILFLMDACYSGLAVTRSVGPGGARFLKDMLLRYSRQVLAAGKADETVADSGGPLPNHSVFTGHLIEGLRGKAATDAGVITAAGLMAYVYYRVATDKNSNQTPHYGHIEGDGDLILVAPNLSTPEFAKECDTDQLLTIPYPFEEPIAEGSFEKVTRAKKLLSTESGVIELHDLMMNEVRRFLSLTSDDSFPVSGNFTLDQMLNRISKYEESVSDLCLLLACTAYWGTKAHASIIQKCIARSSDRSESKSGLIIWLGLRSYPLILQLYTAGIAALDAQNFNNLAIIFNAKIAQRENSDYGNSFAQIVANEIKELNNSDVFQKIPGHEQKYTPLSEYLLKILQPRLDDTFFLGKNYESTFDEFEVFLSLVVLDLELPKHRNVWGTMGRFWWKYFRGDSNPLARIINEAHAMKDAWPPIRSGMFGGSFERFVVVANELEKLVTTNRMR